MVKANIPVVCFLVSSLLSGCAHLNEWKCNGKIGPNHTAPSVCIEDDWASLNSPHMISVQNAVDDDMWWQNFSDPNLNHVVVQANEYYLPLRAAGLRIEERQLLNTIAVGNLFPQQQEAFAEYSRIQNSDNGNPVGIAGLGDTFDLYQVGFNASWELDVWGRLRRLVESSNAKVQVSIADERDIRLCLSADAAAVYTEIRVLQQRLRIAREQLSAQNETVRIAKARYDNGSATKLDTTQATAVAESTRAAIPRLESQLTDANNRLCVFLGSPTRVLFDEANAAQIPNAPEAVVIGMPRDLLRRRPDIRRAEREVAAQSALIGVAAAELLPTFALKGTINWQAFELPDLFESASNAGAIVPGVRWNILNYGRLKNNVAVQRNRLQQTIVAYQQTVLRANAEAESAQTQFVKKKEEIESLSRVVAELRKSVATATTQYREGNIDLDRVNNLRKDLIASLDAETTAQGQAAIALIRVFKTMGGGWTVDATPPTY